MITVDCAGIKESAYAILVRRGWRGARALEKRRESPMSRTLSYRLRLSRNSLDKQQDALRSRATASKIASDLCNLQPIAILTSRNGHLQNYVWWLTLILAVVLVPTVGLGQTVEWATKAAEVTSAFDSVAPNGIDVDASGNSYLIGVFNGTATFDSVELTSPGSFGDLFLAKYGPNGDVLWVEAPIGGGGDSGNAIDVDAAGNSYITGSTAGSISFGSFPISVAGGFDIFVAKYDSNGIALWAKTAGGAGLGDAGLGIAVDGEGNSYVTGSIVAPATFGSITLNTGNLFVAKYDPSGNVLWAQSASSTSVAGISVDATGNCYVIGNYGGTATFGLFEITAVSGTDIFLVKYDTSGNVVWVRSAGGNGSIETARDISVDAAGNSYLTGIYEGGATFGPFVLQGGVFHSLFVAKYDSEGNIAFARSIAGITSRADAHGVSFDAAGNSYVTGDFGGGAFGPFTLDKGAFLANFDTNGNLFSAQSSGPDAGGTDMSIDTNGNNYVVGSLGPTATFGEIILTNADGTSGLFIAKYSGITDSSIPTLSEWGAAIMTLLLLTAGTIVYTKRRPLAA